MATLLSGCATPSAPPDTVRVHPSGTYRHAFTELALPESYAGFTRLHVTEYSPDKSNVSGHYNDEGIPSAATIYHYPATADVSPPTREELLAHFEQTMGDVTRHTPAAELLGSGGVTATINGFDLSGAHARFRLPAHPAFPGEVDSHLYLFALDGWYLKFRFSHPETVAETAIPREHEFIAAVRWPVPD